MNNKILRAKGLIMYICVSNAFQSGMYQAKLFLYMKTDHFFFCTFISVHGVTPL